MPSKIVNELIETTDKLAESERETQENIDILIETDKIILLLVEELRKQVDAYRQETKDLRDELETLYYLIKEPESVDDLDQFVNSQSDKNLNWNDI